MDRLSHYIVSFSAGSLLASTSAMAVTADIYSTQDTQVRSVNIGGETLPTYEQWASQPVLDVRTAGGNAFVPYFQFDLSELDIETLNSATLSLYKLGAARNDTIVNGRFAVYGLPSNTSFSPPNTPQDWVEGDFDNGIQGLDFTNAGFEWTDNGTVDGGVDITRLVSLDPDDDLNGDGTFDDVNITEDVSVAQANGEGAVTITGPDLVSFLTDRLTSTDNPGLVTFLSPIKAVNRGYGFATKEFDADDDPLTDPLTDGSTAFWPTLTLDFVGGGGMAVTGDYNDSGSVEQGDLDLVLTNWGTDTDSSGVPGGWLNDLPVGAVDQAELDIVLTNWGSGIAPSFAGSAVPEPATMALLGGLGVLTLRRRVG